MNTPRFKTRYELIAHRNRRWETDAFVDDKELAVEQARTILERDPIVTAVRVVMLENKEDGIDERPVCTITAASLRGAAAAPPKVSANILPIKSQPKRQAKRGARRSWSRREVALAGVVVAAAVALIYYGLCLPKQQWAFDLPEAQQSHVLRNTFTGEYEKAN